MPMLARHPDGVTAIDTLYVRPQLDAATRAAFDLHRQGSHRFRPTLFDLGFDLVVH